MEAQRPRGSKTENCPFYQKPCSEVCESCHMWTMVQGNDPQTGVAINHWACAIAWGPTLLVNAAQASRSGAVATEDVRNTLMGIRDRAAVALERRAITTNEWKD